MYFFCFIHRLQASGIAKILCLSFKPKSLLLQQWESQQNTTYGKLILHPTDKQKEKTASQQQL